ncbi:6372_t:CDS:1, partial [Funneliformis caledonium]
NPDQMDKCQFDNFFFTKRSETCTICISSIIFQNMDEEYSDSVIL